MITWIACIGIAYLLGAIPFGVIIARACGVNILEHGSHNIGATNVGRVLGRRFGLTCFALDGAKGAAGVLIAGSANGVLGEPAASMTSVDLWMWMAVAVAAVLGHMFSVFIRFRGGKGVATAFGALVAMWPVLTLPAVGALIVWVVVLRLFRFVSLASMIGAAALPVLYVIVTTVNRDGDVGGVFTQGLPPFAVTAALATFVVYKHRANIARIRRGEEPAIGQRSSA